MDGERLRLHPKVVQPPQPLSRENWSKPYSPVFLYKGTRRIAK